MVFKPYKICYFFCKYKGCQGVNFPTNIYCFIFRSLCRVAAMDDMGNFMEFLVDGDSASLTLMSQMIDIDLAVHSIIAVPIEEWCIEYITPGFKCIRKDQR